MDKDTIQVLLNDYVNAPDGSLLIKKGNRFVPISFEELNKKNEEELKELKSVPEKIRSVSRNINHFDIYAKANFINVFNSFKIKVLGGELDVADRKLLNLDNRVIKGEISVKDAIESHPYIKELFDELYIKKEDKLEEVQK